MLSALPIISLGNLCCCMWIISGGLLGSYLDQQQDPRPITVGRGAFTGFMSGMIGAAVWLVVAVLLNAVMAPLQEQMAGQFMRSARDIPPEARAMIESFSGSSTARLVLGFVFMLCAGGMFATLGGVLGAAFFRNDVPPALGGPPFPPPPLPPQ